MMMYFCLKNSYIIVNFVFIDKYKRNLFLLENEYYCDFILNLFAKKTAAFFFRLTKFCLTQNKNVNANQGGRPAGNSQNSMKSLIENYNYVRVIGLYFHLITLKYNK